VPPDFLHHPIAVLTDHPILSPDAEAALVTTMIAGVQARETIATQTSRPDPAILHRIGAGDQARATLARHNLRLVFSIAKRFQAMAGPHLTFDDLMSFGSAGLLQGIDRFDPARGYRLATYVTWWIRQAIRRGIFAESRLIDLPVHVHERIALRTEPTVG
jgi:DNA-directed RNA polymerase sigma subunit (sigma70/sigma32)